MALVECSRCRAKVPPGETTFDERGEYLCARCTDVKDLGDTVERARQAALEKARQDGGGGLAGLIHRWFAVRRAEKEHAAFVKTLPDVDRAPTRCASCGGAVPRGYRTCERCRAAKP